MLYFLSRLSAIFLLILAGIVLHGCVSTPSGSGDSLSGRVMESDSLAGKTEYLSTPFVTAGDRVYMIGTQDGRFPDLGWHIEGEMGGVWDHPIKLLDGFTARVELDGKSVCLDQAEAFINYPYANKHRYRLPDTGLKIERFQYVPDGLEAVLVEYTFSNETTQPRTLNFVWTAYSDLRPTWLGERTSMVDGPDQANWDESSQRWVVKDSLNPWFVVVGSSVQASSHASSAEACEYSPRGKGTRVPLVYSLTIPAGGTARLPLTIAGSYVSAGQAEETFTAATTNAEKNLLAKQKRYAELAQKSKLTIPDKDLQNAFTWVKYNTDWLVREVPEQGRGLSAGLPDYPWWFGVDNEYTLQGALATGRADLVRSTLDLIHRLSEKTNGNGRILHEVSTNGAVFNPGNINETPQFASLVWQTYLWTGDRDILTTYYPTVKKGLAWLLRENDKDGNLLPDGFGMMEIHGLNSEMVDVAVYTQKAFADAAAMATVMGEKEVAKEYSSLAEKLKTKINTDFWVPEFNSFADFIGTPRQALHLIDDAMVRADTLNKPWAVAELKATRQRVAQLPPDQKQGFVLHHNWVVNTPMEMGIADTAKALAALNTGSKFVNPFGVFVTGIDRDESAGQDEGSFGKNRKVFTYTGAVMTLPTGVQAIAENNYGRPDEALAYLKRITRSFGYALPGSIYEVSPDYGMMTQAWNLYSFAVPIVRQFFGIRPEAGRKFIRIQPQMPSSWNNASLENVQIGSNALTMHFERQGGGQLIRLQQTSPEWQIQLAFPSARFQSWEVDGKPVQPRQVGGFDVLDITGTNRLVRVR
jgi:glycogen debranching enzyme